MKKQSKTIRLVGFGLIVLGIGIVLFFGLRTVRSFRRLRPPQNFQETRDVTLIREWMTIGHISRMYAVPENILVEGLELPKGKHMRESLEQINQTYYSDDPGYVLEQIQTIITEYHQKHPLEGRTPGSTIHNGIP